MLWQTDEVRSFRPTVSDEVRQGLWFFESSLFGAGAELARRWQRGAAGHAGRRCASAPGSAATRTATRTRRAAELLDALARARTLALRLYRDEVRELARALGVSDTLVGADAALLASIARDEEELPGFREETRRRNATEPYRRKLTAIWQRLDNELAGRDEPRYGHAAGAAGRPAPDRPLACAPTPARASPTAAWPTCWRRVDIFGLHVARLDVRVHADQVRKPDERLRATLVAVREAQAAARPGGDRHPHRLRHERCGRRRGRRTRWPRRRAARSAIVPLFETIDDLARAPAILGRAPGRAAPGRPAGARGSGGVTVMVGYSDSAKDGGYLAAQWAIHGALVGPGLGGGRARRRAHGLPRPRRLAPAAAAGRRTRRSWPSRRATRRGACASRSRARRSPSSTGCPAWRGTTWSRRSRRRCSRRSPRSRTRTCPAGGGELMEERRRPVARGVRRARAPTTPAFARLLPRLHADRRARAAGDRLAARAPAGRGRRGRGAAGHPVGLRLDAEPLPAARLVRRRHRARPTLADRPAGLRRAARGCTATGRSSARSSTTSR